MSTDSDPLQEKPPLFKSWKSLYLLVLLFHAMVILIFSWITILFI